MSQATLPVINPSNGDIITSLAIDSKESALQKLGAAKACFDDQKNWLPLHKRIALLKKLAKAMTAKQEEFAQSIASEGGKPLKDARVEAARAVDGVNIAITEISHHQGSVITMGKSPSSANRTASTQVFPRGVVLAFSAFNHPLNLIVHQIIPAFATGCPCIVKPASDTPMSCLKLVNLMHEIGIPSNYCNSVITNDTNTSGALAQSEKIAFFSFIGSARVGWMLRSKLHPGVRSALEHGGVAPCIVTPTAQLDKAIPTITKGAFYHAGQVCVSTQRIYVHESILDTFVEQFKAAAQALVVGDARDENTDVGPLIRTTETDRIDQWVQAAINAGSECVAGGKAISSHFYAPTILVNPAKDLDVSQKEVFGPVACVYSYKELDDAIAQANSLEFAFQAAVFTDSVKEERQCYEHIHASAVMINDHTAFRDDAMPFAGLNASGLGTGGIPFTIEDMQFEKMIVRNHN